MGKLTIRLKKYNEGGFMSGYTSDMDADWMGSAQAKSLSADASTRQGAQAVGAGLSKIPNPIAQVAGAALQMGNAIDKASKDQYGIYKSKGWEVADNVIDPVNQFNQAKSSFSDLFSGKGDAQDLLYTFSQGIFGSSKSQAKAKRQKAIFENNRNLGLVRDATNRGAAYDYAVPQYQAPAYGAKGVKLSHPGVRMSIRPRTKFSKSASSLNPLKTLMRR